jgi:hypothetical protein
MDIQGNAIPTVGMGLDITFIIAIVTER